MNRLNVCAILGFLLWSHCIYSEEIINTLDWPPYIDKHDVKGGFLLEIIDHIFKKANIQYNVQFNPAARVHKNLTNPNYFATVPYFKTGDAKNVMLPRPFAAVSLVFYQLKNNIPILIKSSDDLIRYRVGMLENIHELPLFAKYTKTTRVKSYLSLFHFLENYRVELVLADRFAAEYFLSSSDKNNYRAVVAEVSPPFKIEPIYIAFNKLNPNAKSLFDRFNKALNEAIVAGELIDLYDKYDYKTMSSQLFSEEDITGLINRAQGYIDENGEKRAFVEFRKPESKFNYGEIYIFALSTDGVLVAHPFPELNGKLVINLRDKLGFPLIQEFLRIAEEKSEGWVNYWWKNPVTEKVQLKTTYIRKVSKHLILGAGIYR
ncbi:cache domain-containing protein [Zooshikella ganghwensis]|uniref:cache domain-containing protein n=1 Tax=Zooshikella ganghwensis TaxID=202772 RepID=UPI0004116DDD|nr:cache domain-containing protein [Zooshikella ganghwensis]